MPSQKESTSIKSKPSVAEARKERKDKSAPINEQAFEILEVAKAKGYKKINFASEAIIAYAERILGDDVPQSSEKVIKYRLKYLERIVSEIAWESLCDKDKQYAMKLWNIANDTHHHPFSRKIEKMNEIWKKKEEYPVPEKHDWITAAFAVKYKFSHPQKSKQ